MNLFYIKVYMSKALYILTRNNIHEHLTLIIAVLHWLPMTFILNFVLFKE